MNRAGVGAGARRPRSVRVRGTVLLALLPAFFRLAAAVDSSGIRPDFPETADPVVDAGGAGDFRTITAALEALPMYSYGRVVIFIRDGVYEESLRIDRNYVTLRGESRDGVVIRSSRPRPAWEADKDWIGPAVVNIHGDDVILERLTVENSQPDTSVHAFAVLGAGTRTILADCRLLSRGGDTVALWNYKEGMYYHSRCEFRGAVDMVCPRGWCFIRDSRFFEVRRTAAVWHAGSWNPDQKLVIRDSEFDGVPGFHLGRRHYDAQFFLIGCRFSAALADRPVYRVVYDDPARNNPDDFGDRVYFHGCLRDGGLFPWMRDNLGLAAGGPRPEDVTPAWTFGGRWDPESVRPVQVTSASVSGDSLTLTFDDRMTVRGRPVLRNRAGDRFEIVVRRYTDNDRLTFRSASGVRLRDASGEWTVENGSLIGSTASARERSVGPVFRIPPCQ
ncbi:MAG: pectinesterase family protein [bacterium]|nr:pectinesterase family protein [bacterium]